MTIIAALVDVESGVTRMASDSQTTTGGGKILTPDKLWSVHKRLALGMAGAAWACTAFRYRVPWPKLARIQYKDPVEWVVQWLGPAKEYFAQCGQELDELEFLVALDHHLLSVAAGDGWWVVRHTEPFAAVGSGAPYALGYMTGLVGRPSALENAVAAAKYHAPECGGDTCFVEVQHGPA